MRSLSNLSLACILWAFPFFSLPQFFVETPSCPPVKKVPVVPIADEDSSAPEFRSAKDRQQYERLTRQIDDLTNLRDYYEGRIERYRDRANYYQFQGGEYPLDSQSLLNTVKKYQCIVDRINKEIGNLERERRGIADGSR